MPDINKWSSLGERLQKVESCAIDQLNMLIIISQSKHVANQGRDCAPPVHITRSKIWPIDLPLTSGGKIFQLCSLICHMTTTGVASCVKSSSGRPLRTKLLVFFFVHCIVQLAMMAYIQCVMLFNLGSCFSKCWASLQWWPVYFWRFCSLERKTDHLNVRVNL